MGMRKRCPTILDPYLSYLQERWSEGCHNGLQLFREIQKQGYAGSRPSVSRWAWQMRKQEPKPGLQPSPTKSRSRVIRPWSPRYAVWLLLHCPDTLSAAKKGALERMMTASSMLRQAYECAQEFIQIIRQRQATALEPWLTTVIENRIPALSESALGLEGDKEAVLAALTLPWSNGQVEGHVNRLKLIKRQMYGRAHFDLTPKKTANSIRISGPGLWLLLLGRGPVLSQASHLHRRCAPPPGSSRQEDVPISRRASKPLSPS